jgi:copper resistance protein C
MSLRRGLIALLLAGVALLATATPALAHARLEGSSPAAGAALAKAPARISLTFNEPVTLAGSPIRVTGPATWRIGAASVTDTTLSASVTAGGPAGAYTLSWSVVSADGDPISGTIRFTLSGGPAPRPTVAPAPKPAPKPATTSKPAAPEPSPIAAAAPVTTPAPTTSAATTSAATTTTEAVPTLVPTAAQTPDSDGGVPWWVWIVGGAVVVAGAGWALALRGRGPAR